ncbi:hypothetical protein D3C71_480020 [compost metagenome]
MKTLFVLCLLALQGCATPHVPPARTMDYKWSDSNRDKYTACSFAALEVGKESAAEVKRLALLCYIKKGVMI